MSEPRKVYDPNDQAEHIVYKPKEKTIWAKAHEARKKRERERAGESSIVPAQKMRAGYEFEGYVAPADEPE